MLYTCICYFLGLGVHQMAVDPVTKSIFYRGFNYSTYTFTMGVIYHDGRQLDFVTELRLSCCFALHPRKRYSPFSDYGLKVE